MARAAGVEHDEFYVSYVNPFSGLGLKLDVNRIIENGADDQIIVDRLQLGFAVLTFGQRDSLQKLIFNNDLPVGAQQCKISILDGSDQPIAAVQQERIRVTSSSINQYSYYHQGNDLQPLLHNRISFLSATKNSIISIKYRWKTRSCQF